MIRMINQTGDGYADAYSEHDAKSYEDKGWKRVSEQGDDHLRLIKAALVDMVSQSEEVKPAEAPRKRGRPAKA